ncbi:MAG TPA: hypothetical protein VGQ49_00670 [Bryobacteraceae bacterium]|nr:hypothetical protein [Bryobacteraceae bacterium]
MSSKELHSRSIRELERLRANCLRGSINEELITPILEAKRRKVDSRRMWIVAIMGSAVALLGLAGRALPQRSVKIHNGFLKAQTYLELTPDDQRAYVMGALDGIYMAPIFGAPENDPGLVSLEACVEGMKGSQVAAIVLKYAKDHPERWNWDLKDVTYSALREVCPMGSGERK